MFKLPTTKHVYSAPPKKSSLPRLASPLWSLYTLHPSTTLSITRAWNKPLPERKTPANQLENKQVRKQANNKLIYKNNQVNALPQDSPNNSKR